MATFLLRMIYLIFPLLIYVLLLNNPTYAQKLPTATPSATILPTLIPTASPSATLTPTSSPPLSLSPFTVPKPNLVIQTPAPTPTPRPTNRVAFRPIIPIAIDKLLQSAPQQYYDQTYISNRTAIIIGTIAITFIFSGLLILNL